MKTAIKWLTSWHWSSYALMIFMTWTLWQRIPSFWEMHASEGTSAQSLSVQIIANSNLNIQTLPLKDKKQLIVFWATWCGPCKLELNRIQNLINLNKIPSQNIFAISVGENTDTILTEVKKQGYTFPIGEDPDSLLAGKFKVVGTPTLIFINNDGKIEWKTNGISPSLEARLIRLFN